jgi:hypothetical protein
MDGSPNSGRFHATTLWHIDAVEWAPSTSSKADTRPKELDVRFTPKSGIWGRREMGAWSRRVASDQAIVPHADKKASTQSWETVSNVLIFHVRFFHQLGEKRCRIKHDGRFLIPPYGGSNPPAPASQSRNRKIVVFEAKEGRKIGALFPSDFLWCSQIRVLARETDPHSPRNH